MQESPPTDDTQRYQLGECIGRGGLGAVFRAWDARLGRWVAIKRLTIDPALGTLEVEEKMRREANALAALQHPNVVTIHDFGTDEEGPFVVMELIEGRTLEAFVEQAPFDYESFRELARQTLAGVGAAHRAGLLHRDLKPGNVMLAFAPDGSFQVKLLDFGLAKFAPLPMAQTMDQGNGLLGTIPFMAPEQFGGGTLDARTDLYALGCVFYYTLTGQHPFDGESVAEIMASHLQHRVDDLGPLRPDLPPSVAEWVMRLLSLAPDDRPAGADEAAAALRAATGGTAIVPREPAKDKGARGAGRFPGRLLAVLGLCFAAAGLGGYFLWCHAAPARSAAAVGMPSISLFADVPVAHATGGVPGCFTVLRSGDPQTALTVAYTIHGSAKNGLDYAKVPTAVTIKPGETSEKIPIVPLEASSRAREDRHVRFTLLPANTYTVATPNEVKVKIVYDR